MASTDVDICNGALTLLGDQVITTLTDSATNSRERLCFHQYPDARDTTLAAFGWHEALVRVKLTAYTEPAFTLTPAATTGTNILFTASGAAFVAGDVGKDLRGDGVPGRATITAFNTTATVHADITQDFLSTSAIASGAWRLYNPIPAWGEFSFSFVKPTGLLRVYRVDNRRRYAVEGQSILYSLDTMNMVYITQLTDVTKWGPLLENAVEALLAATIAEPVTGSSAKVKQMYDIYNQAIREARGTATLEGSPDLPGPYPALDVRNGGVTNDIRAWGMNP